MDTEKRICLGCKKEYSAIIGSSQKYHSRQCANIYAKKPSKKIKDLQNANLKIKEDIDKCVVEDLYKIRHKKINNLKEFLLEIEKDNDEEVKLIIKLPSFHIKIIGPKLKIKKYTNPENAYLIFLEKCGLESGKDFYTQYTYKKYRIDFYIPKLNLGIEIDGDYWHANPKKYKPDDMIKFPNGTIMAKEIWERNKYRESVISKDIKIQRFWESEINDKSYIDKSFEFLKLLD